MVFTDFSCLDDLKVVKAKECGEIPVCHALKGSLDLAL